MTVGAVQVAALCDVVGDFRVALDVAFPGVERAAWAPYRRAYPEAFSGTDRWRLRDWCFVVRAGNWVVLVDTGVGEAGTLGATWIGASGRLPVGCRNSEVARCRGPRESARSAAVDPGPGCRLDTGSCLPGWAAVASAWTAPAPIKEAAMSGWLWVLIIVVVAVLLFGVMRGRRRR
jgi:hypothetical protein